MTTAEIRQGIEELGPWFYCFEFGGGLETTPAIPPSVVDIFETRLRMLTSAVDAHFGGRLRDIECLDIGCHEGFYALAMARRGVRTVVAIDARPENLNRARFVAEAMGVDNIAFRRGLVETLAADLLETGMARTFPLTLFLGLLYHVEDPMRCLRQVAAVTGELCILETQVVDEVEGSAEWGSRDWKRPYQGILALIDETGEFDAGNRETGVSPMATCPSPEALLFMLKQAGFKRAEILPASAGRVRAACAWQARCLRRMEMSAVEVRNLSKSYPLSNSQLGRLRHLFASRKHHPEDGLWALREVSFSVLRGEAFGIIGANGSGKSTLLQIIAGILQPTSGSVQVNGRLSALLELGSGFSPEFTGRDNVYLNASLHGLSRREIDDRLPEIERFAGIGTFVNQPIRTYSTGMVLRLAFAVAAHIAPDILIVDEALAVGDIAFRQRCMRKIHELRSHGTTILFVSHETSDVKALCERCLWLRDGMVQECGEADAVVAKYLSAVVQKELLRKEIPHKANPREEVRTKETQRMPDDAGGTSGTLPEAANGLVSGFDAAVGSHRFGDGRVAITGADLVTHFRQSIRTVTPLDRLVLRIGFRVNGQVASPIAGFVVRNNRGEDIFGSNTARENYPLPPMAAGDANNVDFHWSVPALAPGAYKISLGVADGDIEDHHMCDYIEDAIGMTVAATDGSSASRGYFQLHCAAVSIHANQRR